MRVLHLNAVGVRYRLGLLVLLSIIALLAVGFGGWLGISKVSRSVLTLQDERLPAAMLIGKIRSTTKPNPSRTIWIACLRACGKRLANSASAP